MKTASLIAALLVSVLSIYGGQINVTYSYTDFQLNAATNGSVTLYPLSTGISGNYIVTDSAVTLVATNGSVTFSNVLAGYAYRATFRNFNSTILKHITNSFPSSLSGNVNASDWVFYTFIVNGTNASSTTSGGTTNGGGVLAGFLTNAVFSARGTNAILSLATNPPGHQLFDGAAISVDLAERRLYSASGGQVFSWDENGVYLFSNTQRYYGNGQGLTNVDYNLLANRPNLTASNFVSQTSLASSNYVGTNAVNSLIAASGLVGTNSIQLIDPLAASYASSNNITDGAAIDRLNRFVKKLRRFSPMPVSHWNFNPTYNPQNHIDLFGSTNISFTSTESYNKWGIYFSRSNGASITLPATYTNWTVFIYKSTERADHNINYGSSASYINNGEFLQFSFENSTNAQGWFVAQDCANAPNNTLFIPMSGSTYYSGKTINNPPLVTPPLATDVSGRAPVTPPAVWCLGVDASTNWLRGWYDILPLFNTRVSTVLLTNGGVTNIMALNQVNLGISTNWNTFNVNGWNGTMTNGVLEVFSVTVFPCAPTYQLVTNFFAAVNELMPSKEWDIWTGDSMISEDAKNRIPLPNNYPQDFCTNFLPYAYHILNPSRNWRTYAQGGANIHTFLTNSGINTVFPLADIVSLLPTDHSKTVYHDFPRNSLLFTTAVNFEATNALVASAFMPIKQAGARVVTIESVLPATNSINSSSPGNWTLRSNLVYGYINLRTNAGLRFINKSVPVISYFYGSVWDTNKAFFVWDSAGGFHVEGTNSPLFYRKQASMVDTGFWPDSEPVIPQLQ